MITVNSGSICTGQSFTLLPGGASTYTISGGNTVVNPVTNTEYTVTGTNANGCVSDAVISSLMVNDLPFVSAASNHSIICIGASATLIAAGATSYAWSNGANTPSLVISVVVNTTYSVTGTDANGCSNTAMVTQSVDVCSDPPPVGFATQAKDEHVFTLYPNPNAGNFTIEAAEGITITITTMLGEEIATQQLQPGKNSIDLSGQPNGVYFINYKNAGLKIIKQ